MKKIIVFHSSYGCDTGCCGHIIRLVEGEDEDENFVFDHPYGSDPLVFAQRLVIDYHGVEHVKDLAWDECMISDG